MERILIKLKSSGVQVLISMWIWVGACTPDGFTNFDPAEVKSGGEFGTHEVFGRKAFDKSAPGVSKDNFTRFQAGNSFFRSSWVVAPSSTSARDGLGPLYNSISCTGCHIHDGRGRPPLEEGAALRSMLVRVSLPGQSAHGGPLPHPAYGTQIQNRSAKNFSPEGELDISYEEISGTYPDGTPYTLLKPTYRLRDLQYGAVMPDLELSPRTAPAVLGMGLLEAIPEAAILNLADEDDTNEDGISGRPNWVYDFEQEEVAMGRFGWKANQPSLRQQNASAFGGDLGLTTSLFPGGNCGEEQIDCQDAPNGGEPEITDDILDFVTAYTRSLGVPARREADSPQVLAGKALFTQVGCTSCHNPSFETEALPGFPEIANQTIFPYTDMLLHDMGPDLADNRPDYKATGQEWRTPPLWGLGLIEVVNGHTRLLHDGRARNMTEAILWHGGEAAASQAAFRELSGKEREDLIAFLKSL
ncbi:MAG: di-heme oxidoredictase family protein [Bacteroidota bacterium]